MDIINVDSKILASISGVLLGFSMFFVKIAISSGLFGIGFFINPLTWLAAGLGLAGFLIMQKSFHDGYVSVSISLIAGISIIIPVVLANMFLGEVVGMDWLGIVLILLGVLILGFGSKHKEKKVKKR
ncbi:MAG: hypothetical protein HY831_03295 [Candidatus Aenigmarchaeota archaeon]|nr:hypothetical protein [Candidatus Aenigmarchaeota archaeon]